MKNKKHLMMVLLSTLLVGGMSGCGTAAALPNANPAQFKTYEQFGMVYDAEKNGKPCGIRPVRWAARLSSPHRKPLKQ